MLKICFIWVEKYRNFENFGFNLNSSVKFSYSSDTNKIEKKEVPAIPKNFFGDKITDIIGIIGKNGVGKSNAVDLVCSISKGGKTSLNSDFFIITEEQGGYVCYHSFFFEESPTANFNIRFVEYTGSLDPLKVVFFSNVFDERRNDFSSEVTDISVYKSFRRTLFLLRQRAVSDFEKQITFINSKFFTTLNIDFPSKVQFSIRNSTRFHNNYSERLLFRDSQPVIQELQKIFRDRIKDIRPRNKFIHLLTFNYFFECLSHQSRRLYEEKSWKDISDILGDFLQGIYNEKTEVITEKLLLFLENHLLGEFIGQPDLFEDEITDKKNEGKIKIKAQIDFLKKLKGIVRPLDIHYQSEGSRDRELEHFTFDYLSPEGHTFINQYVTLFGGVGVFDVNWLGISSGHKAYLNLFSSLFYELKYSKKTNLLLCIDEGDLYLHPKWQIEFVDKLLTVLPTIYQGNIQLILTSHSPFLLSDLPNQNITILDKKVGGSALDGTNLSIKTFGGNLYDLYSEPFFLGDKRTSDFAYNKIKKIINEVENKKLTKEAKLKLKGLSELIGDEIIRFRIKKLLGDD
jgi:hypothetical protein